MKRNEGKTHFNRIKRPGESWTKLRQEAIDNGTWAPLAPRKESPK